MLYHWAIPPYSLLNTINPLGMKFAEVCAGWWVILMEIRKQRWIGTLTPSLSVLGSSNALSYTWRSSTEGHPTAKPAGRESSWTGQSSRNRGQRTHLHPEDREHIFLKEEAVTPENSWILFNISMLDLLLVAGQCISIHASQETPYPYRHRHLRLFFYLSVYRLETINLERNVVLNTHLKIR